MIGAAHPLARRRPPHPTDLAYAWGLERRARTWDDIRDTALNAGVTAIGVVCGLAAGLLLSSA